MTGAAAALTAAALVLVLAAVVAAPLLRADARSRRLGARVQAVAVPLAPARSRGGARRPSLAARFAPSGVVEVRAARVFGWQPERRDQYPAAPAVLALTAVTAALVLCQAGSAMLGNRAWWALPVLAVLASRMLFRKLHGRRADQLYLQLPDALSMIVRGVRAGLPVTEAVRTVSREALEPTAGEFRRLADQVAMGVSFEQALNALARRSGLQEYRFFAVALTLQAQAGGNLTDTLENLADVVRKRVAMRARGLALASQAKASAAILGAVPVIAGLALAVINPGYLALLFEDPRGRLVLGLAVGMLGGGMLVMRGIIRKSLS